MKVKIVRVEPEQKSVLRQLMELYSYDFSEYLGFDVDDHGWYGYPYLDHYWTELNRHPFFIRAKDKLAGFVLVTQNYDLEPEKQGFEVAEFFVMRKYRRQGIGRQAASKVFDLLPGVWKVSVVSPNQAALKFWQKVVATYTQGEYTLSSQVRDELERRIFHFECG
jgi:predicted acetyltransferase